MCSLCQSIKNLAKNVYKSIKFKDITINYKLTYIVLLKKYLFLIYCNHLVLKICNIRSWRKFGAKNMFPLIMKYNKIKLVFLIQIKKACN